MVARLPEEPGVYRFRDRTGRTLYVGRAVNLRRRVGSYWGHLGDRRYLARMIPRIARVEALVCDSGHEAAWTERNMLQRSLPRWNRVRGGLESAVYLHLDPSPGAARLDLTFRAEGAPGVRVFGPYLGSRKVRHAVSGLQRVYPLHCHGAARTPAERELARIRGDDQQPLAELTAAITGVLRRDPLDVAAVLAELERRRDAAAAELRFETAGRIQEELAAVEWVVAPQRATVAGGGDVDVSGWSDGSAVSLTVRDGLLCGWTCRPSTRPGSGVRGPQAWAEFVRRNAELAADLARP